MLIIPFTSCKRAYKEPEEVAFPDKKDVDENYKRLLKCTY